MADVLQDIMRFCQSLLSSSEGTLVAFLVLGLVAGLTHCSVMCGPVMLGLEPSPNSTSSRITASRGHGLLAFLSQSRAPYHAGRLVTYVSLALVFTLLMREALNLLPVRDLIIVPMLLLAALLFIAGGFPVLKALLPVDRWLASSTLARLIGRGLARSNRLPSASKPFVIGLLTGFMPCGITLAILMTVAASGDPLWAAGAMASFGLGTAFALGALAVGASLAVKRLPLKSSLLKPVLSLVSGVWLLLAVRFGAGLVG